jgi:hypothetical protein
MRRQRPSWPSPKARGGRATWRPPTETDLASVVAMVVVAVLLLGVAYLVDWPEGTRELVRWLLEAAR